MADVLTVEQRSANMRAIRSRDTKPEISVRRLLHRMGFRFRVGLRVSGYRPDVVFTRRKKVILVNGCFWHRHPGCRYATTPASREEFWQEKFRRNVERDQRLIEAVTADGWLPLVVWECETRDPASLSESLRLFLADADSPETDRWIVNGQGNQP